MLGGCLPPYGPHQASKAEQRQAPDTTNASLLGSSRAPSKVVDPDGGEAVIELTGLRMRYSAFEEGGGLLTWRHGRGGWAGCVFERFGELGEGLHRRLLTFD